LLWLQNSIAIFNTSSSCKTWDGNVINIRDLSAEMATKSVISRRFYMILEGEFWNNKIRSRLWIISHAENPNNY